MHKKKYYAVYDEQFLRLLFSSSTLLSDGEFRAAKSRSRKLSAEQRNCGAVCLDDARIFFLACCTFIINSSPSPLSCSLKQHDIEHRGNIDSAGFLPKSQDFIFSIWYSDR